MTLSVVPASRYSATMSALGTSQLILQGGKTMTNAFNGIYGFHGILADTWSFSCTTGLWSNISTGISAGTVTTPGPIYDAISFFDGTYVILTGGRNYSSNLSNTYNYSVALGWVKQAITDTVTAQGAAPSYGIYSAPTTLSGACAAYQSTPGTAILFGGEAAYQRHYSLDSWQFTSSLPGSWLLLTPTVWPTARKYAAMASSATTAVMFGGIQGGTNVLGDTFTYTGSNQTWTQVTGLTAGTTAPYPVYGASMAYNGSNYILFGGRMIDGTYSNTCWSFNSGTKVWTKITGTMPAGRAFASMAYAGDATNAIIMFGGLNYGDCLGDTWSYASGVFTQLG